MTGTREQDNPPAIRHEIQILDLDAGRLMVAENQVKAAVRKANLRARVSMMADNLAITREGLLDSVPVIKINGRIVSRKAPVTPELLTALFSRLLS